MYIVLHYSWIAATKLEVGTKVEMILIHNKENFKIVIIFFFTFLVEDHTNTTLNSSKKNDKETKKLWGLKQNQKASIIWHEDERLWISVYKIVEVQEVKSVSGNTESFVLCEREDNLETINSRK